MEAVTKIKEIFKRNTWKIVIVSEAMILGVIFFVKIFSTFESYTIPIMSGTPDIGEIYEEGGYYTFDQDEDAQAALALDDYIPFHISIPVKAGSYTITLDYKSSSYSTLRLYSPSDSYAVQCDDFMMYENKEQLTSNLIVKRDLEDMDICVKYGGHGWFDVRGITLQGNHKDILPLMLKWLFIFFIVDVVIWLRKKNLTFANCESVRVGCVLIIYALIASLPMFIGFLPIMDDSAGNFVRIEGIKDALTEGQIPAFIHPNSILGYGYANSVFYPEILMYFPAIMRIIGFSFIEAYKTFVFVFHLLTAGIAYYSVKKIFKSVPIGLFGSFLYTFSIYRLIDVYRRAATGEFCAMAFLPLVVYGFYRILTEDIKEEGYKQSWIPLTIGLWGVANTHLLSCEMVAIFVIPICVICIRRILQKARLCQMLKAAAVTVLLTLYFIVPFIYMSLKDSYKVFTNAQSNVPDATISFFQTFSLFFSQVGSAVGFTEGNPPRDLGIGFVFLLGIVLYIYIKGRRWNAGEDRLREQFCVICAVFGCIAIWMTTYHFPWSQIGRIGGIVEKIFSMVQFPWRYTTIATTLLMFVICDVIYILFHSENAERGIGNNRILAYITMTLFIALTCVQTLYYFQTVPREGITLFYYEEAGLPMSGGNGYGEYEPTEFTDVKIGDNIWTVQEKYNDAADNIEIVEFDKYGTDSVLSVNNPTLDEQRVYLPILYYPGYVAFDIFSHEPLAIFKTEKGTLGVILPARYMSAVKIEYHISSLYRVGEAASLLTLIGLLIMLFTKRCKI